MTSKEKAIELTQAFAKITYHPMDRSIDAWNKGKECAIIAVEEIIEIMRGYDTDYACDCGYYQKVLTELKSMQ